MGKMLECSNCKAKWDGGKTTDTQQIWLTLKKPANNQTGTYLLNKPFPLTFWQDPNRPHLAYDNYAKAIHETFEDLQSTPLEIGKATFNGPNVLLWAPSADCVAEILPYREDNNVTIAVIDLTTKLNDQTNQENAFFYHLVSKRLDTLAQQTPITPYLKIDKTIQKAEENRFYPYKEKDITIPAQLMPHLMRHGVIKEAQE